MKCYTAGGPGLAIMRSLRTQPGGLTAGQMAGNANLDRPAVNSAVKALRQRGDVRAAGKISIVRPQNYATLWQATEQGLERLRRTEGQDRTVPPYASLTSRRYQILAALRDKPGGLTVRDLLGITGEDATLKYQTWYGSYLRDFRDAGHVRMAGKTETGWGHAPAFIWDITHQGRIYLTASEGRAAEIEEAAERAAAARAEETASELRRDEALTTTRAKFRGHRPPPHEREPVAIELRNLGCTLEEIGSVFGITREQARLDLLRPVRLPGLRGRPAKRGRRRKAQVRTRICPHCLSIV